MLILYYFLFTKISCQSDIEEEIWKCNETDKEELGKYENISGLITNDDNISYLSFFDEILDYEKNKTYTFEGFTSLKKVIKINETTFFCGKSKYIYYIQNNETERKQISNIDYIENYCFEYQNNLVVFNPGKDGITILNIDEDKNIYKRKDYLIYSSYQFMINAEESFYVLAKGKYKTYIINWSIDEHTTFIDNEISLPEYFYFFNITKATFKDNCFYIFTYKENTSSFLFYKVNISSSFYIMDDILSTHKLFLGSKFIKVDFFENTSFIYYLLKKGTSNYLGVYDLENNILLFNYKVNSENVFQLTNNENDLQYSLLFEKEGYLKKICPFYEDQYKKCIFSDGMKISKEGNEEKKKEDCNDYHYKNYCVEKCPLGTVINENKMCDFKCYSDYKLNLNTNECVYECDDNEIQISKYCVSCELNNIFLGHNLHFCVENCTESFNKPYNENNICLLRCKIGSIYDEKEGKCISCKSKNEFYNEENNTCVKACPYNIYDNNNVCYNCKDRGLYLFENENITECINDCANKNLIVEENKCISCPNGQLYLNDSSKTNKCVEECPEGYIKINETCQKCIDYSNGKKECINYINDQIFCNIGSEIDIESKECINCLSIGKVYSNGTCVEYCDDYKVKKNGICIDCVNNDVTKFFSGSECLEICPNNSQISGYICNNCEELGKKYFDGNCYDNCVNYTFEHKREKRCMLCHELYPETPFFYNTTKFPPCKANCSDDEAMIDEERRKECKACDKIYRGECKDECPKYTFLKEKKCINCMDRKGIKGNEKQFFYDDGKEKKCVDECIEGTAGVKTEQTQICEKCNDIYYDGKCENKNSHETYVYYINLGVEIHKTCYCNVGKGNTCLKLPDHNYKCKCNGDYTGDFCNIYHPKNDTNNLTIYSISKYPLSKVNDILFTFNYIGNEKIVSIEWNAKYRSCEGTENKTKEDKLMNGVKEEIFMIHRNFFDFRCNYEISLNVTLENEKILRDSIVFYTFHTDFSSSQINFEIDNSMSYCPTISRIYTTELSLPHMNSSENYTFQFCYIVDEIEKENKDLCFEFSKKFFLNHIPKNWSYIGNYVNLKMISTNGNYELKTWHDFTKGRNCDEKNITNISDIIFNFNNTFQIAGKLISFFEDFGKNDLNLYDITLIEEFVTNEFTSLLNKETNESGNENDDYYTDDSTFLLIKANTIPVIVKQLLDYIKKLKKLDYYDKGLSICNSLLDILSNYNLDYTNIIYYYIYRTYLYLYDSENTFEQFKQIILSIEKLSGIISKSLYMGQIFQFDDFFSDSEFTKMKNRDISIFKIIRFGKNEGTISFYKQKSYTKVDSCKSDNDTSLVFCLEKDQVNDIIDEIYQFEKKNKTNIGLSFISYNIQKSIYLNYLSDEVKEFINNDALILFSDNIYQVNLFINDSFSQYKTKKNYVYSVTFEIKYDKESIIEKDIFCAPLDSIGKFDPNNFCYTYFLPNSRKYDKTADIRCVCNNFTLIGAFGGDVYSIFYQDKQFKKNENVNLFSYILIYSSIGSIVFFSIILLSLDINEEKIIKKISKMNKYQKVDYYYNKVSYLHNANRLTFSWYLFYFYNPFLHLFNIYNKKISRHFRFMIEMIKILITLICTLYFNFYKTTFKQIKDFVEERKFEDKDIKRYYYKTEWKVIIICSLLSLFFYIIVSLLFDFLYNYIGFGQMNEKKFKPIKNVLSKFIYNKVRLDGLMDEKGIKLRTRIYAFSKIMGEKIIKNLQRKQDKLAKYLNEQEKDSTREIIDSGNSGKEHFLDDDKSNQTSFISNISLRKKTKISNKYNKYSEIFKRYMTIHNNKIEGKLNNEENDNLFSITEILEEENEYLNNEYICWNIISNLVLIALIIVIEIEMKQLVDEVYQEYEGYIINHWLIPSLIAIIFYNFIFHLIICFIISSIFFRASYRTHSQFKKKIFKKLIINYRYIYKIMILITKNKTDIDSTLKSIKLEKIEFEK